MKKTLEAELMSIAHRILQLRSRADIHELKTITGVLYEKLTVLSFTEKHFEGVQPTIGKKQVEEALQAKETVQGKPSRAPEEKTKEKETEEEKNPRPDGMAHNTEAITEPNTEKIKDIVAEMPPEAENVEEVLNKILPTQEKNEEDVRNIGVHFDDLPQFEPVSGKKPVPSSEEKTSLEKEEPKIPKEKASPKKQEPERPNDLFGGLDHKETSTRNNTNLHKTSLNERLNKGINIGLNDRLAYIKHLFEGNAADYNRVLSQLNTIDNLAEAKQFIDQVVKPDYNNWEGKELYENRFMHVIENKFE